MSTSAGGATGEDESSQAVGGGIKSLYAIHKGKNLYVLSSVRTIARTQAVGGGIESVDVIHKVGKMPEIQLGAHTFRNQGVEVAKFHMHDWLILFRHVVIVIVLNVIETFHRFVGSDVMTDLKYPLKDNIIPVWAVPVFPCNRIAAIILPLLVILVFYFIRRDVYDVHHTILGLLYSLLILSSCWLCFPDGKGVFDPITSDVKCTGLKSVIKEGYKSFPSGHSSCVYNSSLLIALLVSENCDYFLFGTRPFKQNEHIPLLSFFLPMKFSQ